MNSIGEAVGSPDLAEAQKRSEHLVGRLASTTAQWLRDQRWATTVTKAGWIAKAMVYAIIGWAAILIATRRPGRTDAEYTGIVTLLVGSWWTRLVLVAIATGLVLYIAFRVVSVLLIDTVDIEGWAHRLAYSASAATYATVAWAALDAAMTGTHTDGRSSIEQSTSRLLESTAGRSLVGAGALVAMGVSGYFVFKGVTRRFLRQLNVEELRDTHLALLKWSGAVGWIGRGAVVAAVAAFLAGAAVQADPSDARGLDRALQEVAVSSRAGAATVFVIGILLMLYALFCAVSAPHRSLTWSDRHDPETTQGGHP